MKTARFFLLFILIFIQANVYGQSFKTPKKFAGFGRMQVGYAFGINDVFNDQKVNPFQIKLVFGKQNDFVGLGVGVATANYKSFGSDARLNLNTTSFSLNGHYNLKPLSENVNSPFIKAGLGYAPRVFRDYAKGMNYDVGLGYLISNKKGGKYFVEAQYQVQHFDGFLHQGGNMKAQALGLGVGLWF